MVCPLRIIGDFTIAFLVLRDNIDVHMFVVVVDEAQHVLSELRELHMRATSH